MALTIAAVAAHKEIRLDKLTVEVQSRTELSGRQSQTRFTSRLELGDGLTARERTILFNSARLCEVHKMLRGEVIFEEHLAGGGD
jgi:uncharacterized OsmC-like protein